MRHKHYDLILEWACGAEIEYCHRYSGWSSTTNPTWDEDTEYRIKLKPKPDVVLYSYSKNMRNENAYLICANSLDYFNKNIEHEPNIKLTYDGETKELKYVEKI